MKNGSERIGSLIALIHEYQSVVQSAIAIFKEYSGIECPMNWRHSGLPRVGKLGSSGQYEYSFHGSGCHFVFKESNREVDFEFGYGGRSDGFSLWNLWEFSQDGTTDFQEFTNKEYIEEVFSEAVSLGLVSQPQTSKQDELYYLVLRNA